MPYRVALKDERPTSNRLNIEHPPAMHIAFGWCHHRHINKAIELTHSAIKALRAGRTSNVEHRIMMSLRFALFLTNKIERIP
jgi:hypothetical protein